MKKSHSVISLISGSWKIKRNLKELIGRQNPINPDASDQETANSDMTTSDVADPERECQPNDDHAERAIQAVSGKAQVPEPSLMAASKSVERGKLGLQVRIVSRPDGLRAKLESSPGRLGTDKSGSLVIQLLEIPDSLISMFLTLILTLFKIRLQRS